MESSQYVGVAPVPLKQYVAYLEAYRAAMPRAITRSRVREAFSHLVLSERVLDQVGPAIGAAHSMFVYGPPGNGKTVIAQAIRNLLEGELAVPHAERRGLGASRGIRTAQGARARVVSRVFERR